MSSADMDASYLAGVKAFPAKTKSVGGQRLKPRLDGGVKVFELTASNVEWEVAPGDAKRAMAFNGMVPGPEIRVQLNDRVRVVLHNRLTESTAIHFHGLDLPNDQDGLPGITQPLVEPGTDYTYEFTVPNAGTHMYHSHMNGSKQIPMGLLGAFIVEGPGEPASDIETSIVLNDGPLGFTINGKSFPATQPIVAAPGQTIRIRYMNEGLQGHPMHLHGMAQTVFAEDGYPVPNPYKLDTLWVAPGQRFDVLVTARPGVWAFHCHILSHAETETGMFGMVTAVVVK
jgi:FtsP/CotA-like multicopper oxidase with cupredoxin domain